MTHAATKLFCFGFGYCAQALADKRRASTPPTNELVIAGTRTKSSVAPKSGITLSTFDGTAPMHDAALALAGTTHVLFSIPPDADGDPAFRWHAADLAALPHLQWLGYLSTVGVYGDTAGGLVDETTPPNPQSPRGARRLIAENQWRDFGEKTGRRVEIFRLPGIYGPGRSAIDAVRNGTARRIIKPGQIFNRIHVDDISTTLARAMALATVHQSPRSNIFNIVDDEPAPPQDVVTYAAELLGVPPPPEIPFEAAQLSPMAQSFYSESKRVSNARLKADLGVTLAYPTYREGLAAIARSGG
jgi:nucleoside-diphosphate-sugar epimerase